MPRKTSLPIVKLKIIDDGGGGDDSNGDGNDDDGKVKKKKDTMPLKSENTFERSSAICTFILGIE